MRLSSQDDPAFSSALSVIYFADRQGIPYSKPILAMANSSMSTKSILFSVNHKSGEVTKLSPVAHRNFPISLVKTGGVESNGVSPLFARGLVIMSLCITSFMRQRPSIFPLTAPADPKFMIILGLWRKTAFITARVALIFPTLVYKI